METFNVGPEGIFIAAKRKYGLPDHIIRERILPVVQEYNAIEDLNKVRADTRYAWPPMEAYGFQPSQLSRSAEIPTFGFEGIRDVRGEAARETAAAQVARARQLDASEGSLQKEWANTNKLVTFTNMLTGGNTSLLPPLKSARGATAASQKKSEVALANEKFFNDLMAFSVQAGGRITGDQLRDFINDSGAGLEQVKALKDSKFFDHLDLGDLVPMHWIEDNQFKTSWHYSKDAADIQHQRQLGKSLKREDVVYKRTLGIESDIVTITTAVANANIRDKEGWDKFTRDPKNKALLAKSPLVMSAAKEMVPDSIWKTGDMEPLFRVGEKGNIEQKLFDVGTGAYNTALGPYDKEEKQGGWSKTLEGATSNEGQKFESLMARMFRENRMLNFAELKLKILVNSNHIRLPELDKAKAITEWWDEESRKNQALSDDKTLLNQFLVPPGDMTTLRIDIGNLNKGKGVSPEAEQWFWEELEKRFPYPDKEPRTLWNPSTGERIDVENYQEKNQAFGDGFTSSEPVDLTPASERRIAKRHQGISEVLSQLSSDARTYQYEGQELSLDEAASFLKKHKQGMSRFTEAGERLFKDEVEAKVKPLIADYDKSSKEIGTIIQSARQGKAGHVALLNTVIRMYDELGAVRESDINLVNALVPWIDQFRVFVQRTLQGETILLTDKIVTALEAISYSTWSMKALYTQEQLAGLHKDFDETVKPSAYQLGGEGNGGEKGTIPGEGVKMSWTTAAGNRVTELEKSPEEMNPYKRANRTPLDLHEYALSNQAVIEELMELGAKGLVVEKEVGAAQDIVNRVQKLLE